MNTLHAPSAAVRVAASGASSPRHAGTRAPSPIDSELQSRHVHRVRDFGVGYGSSSGYGSLLHFIDGHVDPPFRFR